MRFSSLGVSFRRPQTGAVEIQLKFSTDSEAPLFDPNGARLTPILRRPPNTGKHIIQDEHTIEIEYGYQDLPPSLWGGTHVVEHVNSRPTKALIGIDSFQNGQNGDTLRRYYFDPTPNDHSEFDMQQRLYRDLQPHVQTFAYDGAPDLLEVDYRGDVRGNAPPGAGERDMYSLVLHEMGHALGLTVLDSYAAETADGDYDLNPAFLRGAAAAVNYVAADPGHVQTPSNMGAGGGQGNRNLPSATDILSIAALADWSDIQLMRTDFLGGTNWHSNSNWEGARYPSSSKWSEAFVRHGGTVNLSSAATVKSLTVASESTVNLGTHSMHATDLLIDSRDGQASSKLLVGKGGRLQVNHQLDVANGSSLVVESNGLENNFSDVNAANAFVDSESQVLGNGHLIFLNLENNGTIAAVRPIIGTVNAINGTLELSSDPNNGNWDLDGSGSEHGRLLATLGNLRLNQAPNEPFDGEIQVGVGNRMELRGNWVIGGQQARHATVELQGGDGFFDQAQLRGESIDFAKANINVASRATIDANELKLRGEATINLDDDSTLLIESPTSFLGGSIVGAGTVQFNSAMIIERSTSINVDTADLDGRVFSNATWDINHSLEITARAFNDGPAPYTVNTSIDIGGSLAALNVDLQGAVGPWTMAGTLNIDGSDLVDTIKLSGSPVEITGELNVDGRARSVAIIDLQGTLTMRDIKTRLSMAGEGVNTFSKSATVEGPGTIVVSDVTTLLLEGGFESSAKVENHGALVAGGGTGTVALGSLSQTSSGTLHIEILETDVYDQINLEGTAELGGELNISIAPAVKPSVGHELRFELLTASSIDGEFDTAPTHHQGAGRFIAVDYESDKVVLSMIQAKPGDANGDGVFNSGDLIVVFAAGEYEDLVAANSDWTTGDWNGDFEFDSSDLIVAFQDGSYTDAATKIQPVPEPSTLALTAVALILLVRRTSLN
ncbi:MAG: hypothetical protein R3C28_13850 [Pirellulaceae bacterium]